MVIGNGLIANAFNKYEKNNDVIIFASGISDSQNTSKENEEREINLLTTTLNKNPFKTIIYFSTCSIYDESKLNDKYTTHKLNVENLIRIGKNPFIIFRVTNPIGKSKNLSTFLNFFIDKIIHRTNFNIWKNSNRNIIDIDDLVKICSKIIDDKKNLNATINIGSPIFYKSVEIVQTIESHFGIKGNYSVIDKGGTPLFENKICDATIKELKLNFNKKYLKYLLDKYYPKNEIL